jgi:hypothetical protein
MRMGSYFSGLLDYEDMPGYSLNLLDKSDYFLLRNKLTSLLSEF